MTVRTCADRMMRNMEEEVNGMKIKTLASRDLKASLENGGCGECQTSCQSACKTSCGVANQPCEKEQD